MKYKRLGKTELKVPPIIFGTSCLGNLYHALPDSSKLEIMKEWFKQKNRPIVLDTAGKYGAGLALEVIGSGLRELGIPNEDVVISNKLGWFRTPLRTPEPLFEPGVWMDLKHDATLKISYEGVLECWEQGCELLGWDYQPQILSVHDPDEYLAQAKNEREKTRLFLDIIDAYRALNELKTQGKTKAIGVGAKDWKVIKQMTDQIELDWVMLAISFTLYSHPLELLEFIDELVQKQIGVINSAVFNAGFLTGGEYFDYRKLTPDNDEDKLYFKWRENFFSACEQFNVLPADACVQFGMSHPGVVSIALNTSKAERVKQNVTSVSAEIPNDFWKRLKKEELIANDYPYLG